MRCKVVAKACNDCFVEPFHLADGLFIIGSCRQLLHSQTSCPYWKEIPYELQSFVDP